MRVDWLLSISSHLLLLYQPSASTPLNHQLVLFHQSPPTPSLPTFLTEMHCMISTLVHVVFALSLMSSTASATTATSQRLERVLRPHLDDHSQGFVERRFADKAHLAIAQGRARQSIDLVHHPPTAQTPQLPRTAPTWGYQTLETLPTYLDRNLEFSVQWCVPIHQHYVAWTRW